MKRTSTLLIVGIIALIITGSYTGYLFWKKSASEAELKKVEASLSDYKNEFLKYENKEVLEAINAQKTLANLKKDTIEWSKVIKKIRKTIPTEDGTPLVDILSYSGSSSNEISMNVKTFPKRDKPYFDAADLIKAFDNSEFFVDSFVPSISSGIDEEGNQILTFVFGTKYVEETPLEIIENDKSDESESSGVEREAEATDGSGSEELDAVLDEVVTDAIVR